MKYIKYFPHQLALSNRDFGYKWLFQILPIVIKEFARIATARWFDCVVVGVKISFGNV